ncbi:MAG: type II toxin-antitoxin system RelE/ParE family toxin [Bacteroidota bacterium]|jgi:toxin ParE1/3/4
MVKVLLRQAAIDDLNDIWNYTLNEWSEKQADFYYQRLVLAIELIAANPSIGKGYEEIHHQLRGLRTEKHIIFYRIAGVESLEIIRILHERMDVKTRLGE